MAQANPSAPRTGLLTRGLAVAGIVTLVVATGQPSEEALALLTGWGIPDGFSRAVLYATPVLVSLVSLFAIRSVVRGRSGPVRMVIYMAAGAVVGLVLSSCLEIFAGASSLLESMLGPMTKPTLIDVALSVLAAFGLVVGAMIGGVAVFGRPAAEALQVDDYTDLEWLEVRRAERSLFAWSAIGMITLGISCACLTLARLTPEEARLAIVVAGFVSGLVSSIASYVLWLRFDEMQRRHVVEGYSASAIALTLVAFIWAGLQPLGIVPGIDASGVFALLIAVQIIATMNVAAAAMGQTSFLGKAA